MQTYTHTNTYITQELGVPLESGIDVDVTDHKPHMKRPLNVFISNPDKNPRFEEFTKGGGLLMMIDVCVKSLLRHNCKLSMKSIV